MDTFDRRILALIQINNRLSYQEIGERVGLSATACQKRLARLRRSGVVTADVAVLAPEKVERGLCMVVGVRIASDRKSDLDRFKQRMRKAPEVMQCYYVTGAENFILVLSVRDMEEYNSFTLRNFMENPDVAHFVTSVVMDRVKVTLALPVDSRGSQQAP